MKYLFSIHDNYENETKLYSVEAEDETIAGDILAKRYLSMLPRACFSTLVAALERINLSVTSLGSMDSINEIS